MSDNIQPTTQEQIERRLVTQRKFAIWSFLMMITMMFGVLLLSISSDVWADRIAKNTGILSTLVLGFVGTVAAYFGSSAFVSKAGK